MSAHERLTDEYLAKSPTFYAAQLRELRTTELTGMTPSQRKRDYLIRSAQLVVSAVIMCGLFYLIPAVF